MSNKITKVSKNSPQNNSETVDSEIKNKEFDKKKKKKKEMYLSPEKRQQIINDLRSIY